MQRRGSKTSLFLMELLLVILFFSIAAAVCLRVFAAAKVKSRDSADLTAAVLAAESAAECWKASGGSPEEAAALLAGGVADAALTVFYDGAWQPCEPAAAAFRLELRWEEETAEITVSRSGGAALYSLTARSLRGAQ